MAGGCSGLGEAAAQDLSRFALAREEGPIFDYGLVAVRPKAVEGGPWVALVVIGEDADGELVVALPGGAWHRTATRRRVPTASLKSPSILFRCGLAGPLKQESKLWRPPVVFGWLSCARLGRALGFCGGRRGGLGPGLQLRGGRAGGLRAFRPGPCNQLETGSLFPGALPPSCFGG